MVLLIGGTRLLAIRAISTIEKMWSSGEVCTEGNSAKRPENWAMEGQTNIIQPSYWPRER